MLTKDRPTTPEMSAEEIRAPAMSGLIGAVAAELDVIVRSAVPRLAAFSVSPP
jgi:hypothetical protein